MKTRLKIKKGDRIRITLKNGRWGEGIVLTASNQNSVRQWAADNLDKPEDNKPDVPDNWYIELNVELSHGIPKGYAYWKQSYEPGKVELLESAID